MIAHHTLGGCALRTGDLLGSGTISGPTDDERGSLLEMSEGGKKEIQLAGAAGTRTYLKDGDTVSITGRHGKASSGVGFGACAGMVVGQQEAKPE
jgi:fumarylacetoacetase